MKKAIMSINMVKVNATLSKFFIGVGLTVALLMAIYIYGGFEYDGLDQVGYILLACDMAYVIVNYIGKMIMKLVDKCIKKLQTASNGKA